MVPHHLSSAVLEFLGAHIASLEELEVLVALVLSNGRWWDATSMSRELGVPVARARCTLDAFAARNLLDIRVTDDVRYQFRPGTAELESAAAALAADYQRVPAAVVEAVASVAPRRRIQGLPP